jgi:PAN domain
MSVLRRVIFLLLLVSMILVSRQDDFDGVGYGYVPEGKPRQQSKLVTLEQCKTACGATSRCKAFAFRTSKPLCYFYSEVFNQTPQERKMGLYSSGLIIVPKEGFAYAFKRSSFPPPPVFLK